MAESGRASVTDPRERYDDLLVETGERTMDAEAFERHREMEAFQSGWAAGALAFDAEGRVLLVFNADDDQWVAPGGTLKPGESLRDGVIREVREEAGVTVEPVRPRGVTEWTVRHADRSTSFAFVMFEAIATETAIGADLGVDDEAITDAGWF